MTTPLYELKDLEMQGTLSNYLIAAKREGRSVRQTAAELSQKGAVVSSTTVYRWMSQASGKK